MTLHFTEQWANTGGRELISINFLSVQFVKIEDSGYWDLSLEVGFQKSAKTTKSLLPGFGL